MLLGPWEAKPTPAEYLNVYAKHEGRALWDEVRTAIVRVRADERTAAHVVSAIDWAALQSLLTR